MNFKYEDHKAHEGTQKGVLKTYTLPGNFLAEIRTHSPFLARYSFRRIFTTCPRAGFSTGTEGPEQERAARIRQQRSAIERRCPVRIATHDILPSESAATAQPDAVNLPR